MASVKRINRVFVTPWRGRRGGQRHYHRYGGSGRITASAVCSVPIRPTLLVCLNRFHLGAKPSASTGRCASTPGMAGQSRSPTSFGGKTPMAERFAAAEWQTNSPAARLVDALVSFDCRINQIVSVGNPTTFCSVKWPPSSDIQSRGRLMWFDRGYHTAYASSLLTSKPGYHHGTFRFSSLAVDLPFRRVRRGGPR